MMILTQVQLINLVLVGDILKRKVKYLGYYKEAFQQELPARITLPIKVVELCIPDH